LIGLWAGLAAIAVGSAIGSVQSLERQGQRLFFRLRGTVPPPNNIVILSIDQESLSQGANYQANPNQYPEMASVQAWPWQRTAYATAIEKLMAAGARSVSLDVILTDPSIHGPMDDENLRQIVRRYPQQVVLAAAYETSGTPQTGEQGHLLLPHAALQVQSSQSGLVNYGRDPDQRVYYLGEHFIEHVLQPLGLSEGLSSFAIATLRAANIHRIAPPQGHINYYGPPTTFPRVPFWQVLDSTSWQYHQQQGTFRGKIVLIGPIAESLPDQVPTPFSETMPGVEVHANAIATLMEERVIRGFPYPLIQSGVVFLGVIAASILLCRWNLRPVAQLGLALSSALTWGLLSYLAFTQAGLILPTVVPVSAMTLIGISCLVTGAIANRLEQHRLRQTLERYVAAPIVDQILTHYSNDYRTLLQGRRVKAAILFCDLRGFSTLSTRIAPEQLVEQLNEYLNAMVGAILAAGGTVDKFIGDAIMAEFGSPISYGDQVDALKAVQAALGMRQALVVLHQQWQQQGKELLFNGIGIHYGEAIAGDIGSWQRREYALIGDAVNIASRVEGLTRKMWTDILITASLYELVKDQVEAIPIGRHQLKGHEQDAIQLYSLVGWRSESHHLYHYMHENLRMVRHFRGLWGHRSPNLR
jgi:adenylate cyclase